MHILTIMIIYSVLIIVKYHNSSLKRLSLKLVDEVAIFGIFEIPYTYTFFHEKYTYLKMQIDNISSIFYFNYHYLFKNW